MQISINENLVFDNINREITSKKLQGKKVTLGVAAANCLEALLEAKGEIVSQEALINEGWRKHGYEVSPGNVRQVVSQLRRAFSSLKESPELLATVTKKGYRILPIIIPDTLNIVALQQTEQALLQLDVGYTRLSKPREVWKVKISYLAYTALVINIFLVVLFDLSYSTLSQHKTFYQRVTVKITPGTELFVDSKMANDSEYIGRAIDVLTHSPFWAIDKNTLTWIYINGAKNKNIFSFFLCDNDIKLKKTSCTSRVFMGD